MVDFLEHSMVINNFVIKIGSQIKDSLWFDFKESGESYPYLYKAVTASNKDEPQLVMFPNLHITFDELFDIGEY